MSHFRLICIAMSQLVLSSCATPPPEKALCEAQFQQAQSDVAANNLNAYIAGRGNMLGNCASSADRELDNKASAFDQSVMLQMEKNKQYHYLISRDSDDFQHSDYKNYSQYLDKQFDWYSRQAQVLSQQDPRKASQSMSGFEGEVAKYYREAGASDAEYYLAKSYAERYKLGERSPELLTKFTDSLAITPFSSAVMYGPAIDLAHQVGDKKIASMLTTQFQQLNAAWGSVPVEKRRSVRDKAQFLSVAENLPEAINARQKQSLLALAGIRDKVDAGNQQFAERQAQIRAQQERDNAEFASNKAAENQQVLSTITDAAMGAVGAIAGGSNAKQAALDAAADVAVNTSSTPELMSAARSGLNMMAQNANKCDQSTPSGFKQCCKNIIHGKLTSRTQSDGIVVLGCLHPDEYESVEACAYAGDKKIRTCTVSP